MTQENIGYYEIPSPKNGEKPVTFYDGASLPQGVTFEEIEKMKEKGEKIPYLCDKGNPPFSLFPILDTENTNK